MYLLVLWKIDLICCDHSMPQSPHPFSSSRALLQCRSTLQFHHFNNLTNATKRNDKDLAQGRKAKTWFHHPLVQCVMHRFSLPHPIMTIIPYNAIQQLNCGHGLSESTCLHFYSLLLLCITLLN